MKPIQTNLKISLDKITLVFFLVKLHSLFESDLCVGTNWLICASCGYYVATYATFYS